MAESYNQEIREKFEKVLNEYGVTLGYIMFNIQGSTDIQLSHELDDNRQEELENRLDKIYPLNDIDFADR
jgi:thiamine phosphate synthase YjbQ (UPF0047 family)